LPFRLKRSLRLSAAGIGIGIVYDSDFKNGLERASKKGSQDGENLKYR
jgi:hypothetical protein